MVTSNEINSTEDFLWAYYNQAKKVNDEGSKAFNANEPINQNPLILKSLKDNDLLKTRTNSNLTEEELEKIMTDYANQVNKLIGNCFTWKEFFEKGAGVTVTKDAMAIFYEMLNLNENDSIFSINNSIGESYLFNQSNQTTRIVSGPTFSGLTPDAIINNPNLTVCEKQNFLEALAFKPSYQVVTDAQKKLEAACFRLYNSSLKVIQNRYAMNVGLSFVVGGCTPGGAGIIGGSLIATANYLYEMYYESVKYDNCVKGYGYNL